MPAAPQRYLARARLQSYLQPILTHKATIISAPAGYGKSTFISTTLREVRSPVLWISLDHRDNNFSRFWTNFFTALQSIHPQTNLHPLSILQNNETLFEMALTELINEVSKAIPDLIIVFDDYHEIEIKSIHDSIAFLIEYLPERCHLILSSRTTPPLSLSRLRGHGQVFEISARNLLFTLEETHTYLGQVSGLQLTHEQMDIIFDHTEGWILELQMMAIAMQDGSWKFLKALEFSKASSMEYLAEEVLDKQEKDLKEFLETTCVLESFNAALCNAVTGLNDCSEKIKKLLEKNLFLQPLDNEENWYRYHHLFRSLLYARLQSKDTERLLNLHRRAGKWYESQGRIEEAVEHALSAFDFDWAALLIQRLTFIVIGRDKHNTILDWLNRLPQQMINTDMAICLLGSTANEAIRDAEKSRRYSEQARLMSASFAPDAAEKDSDSATALGFLAGTEALGYFYNGDFVQAKEICLRQLAKTPLHENRAQCILNYVLGMYSWANGELEASSMYYLEAQKQARLAGYDYLELHSTVNLANIDFAKGHLICAAEACKTAIQMGTTNSGMESAVLCYAYLLLAEVLYQWNDLDQAEATLQHASDLSEILPEPIIHLNSTICAARIQLASGHQAEAFQISRSAILSQERLASSPFLIDRYTTDVFMTRMWLSVGNPVTGFDHARRWKAPLEKMLEQFEKTGKIPVSIRQNLLGSDIRNIWSECEVLTYIRLKIANKDLDHLHPLIDALIEIAGQTGWTSVWIELGILKAMVLFAEQKPSSAVHEISQVFRAIENENWIRLFVDEGRPMFHLLTAAAQRGVAPRQISLILNAFPAQIKETQSRQADEHEESHPRTEREETQTWIEPLTPREKEILKLIIEGYSNKRISEKLVIALPTVKNHIQVIYQKLDVNSRAQAIRVAHDLGL